MGTITKVFLVIGILVVSLIAWEITFNAGGIIQRGWDAVAGLVNESWQGITGTTGNLIPLYADIFTATPTNLQQVGP